MFRLALGAALVAAIYIHSPLRPGGDLQHDVTALTGVAQDHVAAAVVSSGLAPLLAEAALRHTLSSAAPERAPTPAAGEESHRVASTVPRTETRP